jgi:hypothetical protein
MWPVCRMSAGYSGMALTRSMLRVSVPLHIGLASLLKPMWVADLHEQGLAEACGAGAVGGSDRQLDGREDPSGQCEQRARAAEGHALERAPT